MTKYLVAVTTLQEVPYIEFVSPRCNLEGHHLNVSISLVEEANLINYSGGLAVKIPKDKEHIILHQHLPDGELYTTTMPIPTSDMNINPDFTGNSELVNPVFKSWLGNGFFVNSWGHLYSIESWPNLVTQLASMLKLGLLDSAPVWDPSIWKNISGKYKKWANIFTKEYWGRDMLLDGVSCYMTTAARHPGRASLAAASKIKILTININRRAYFTSDSKNEQHSLQIKDEFGSILPGVYFTDLISSALQPGRYGECVASSITALFSSLHCGAPLWKQLLRHGNSYWNYFLEMLSKRNNTRVLEDLDSYFSKLVSEEDPSKNMDTVATWLSSIKMALNNKKLPQLFSEDLSTLNTSHKYISQIKDLLVCSACSELQNYLNYFKEHKIFLEQPEYAEPITKVFISYSEVVSKWIALMPLEMVSFANILGINSVTPIQKNTINDFCDKEGKKVTMFLNSLGATETWPRRTYPPLHTTFGKAETFLELTVDSRKFMPLLELWACHGTLFRIKNSFLTSIKPYLNSLCAANPILALWLSSINPQAEKFVCRQLDSFYLRNSPNRFWVENNSIRQLRLRSITALNNALTSSSIGRLFMELLLDTSIARGDIYDCLLKVD